jgi:hypothetical protein
MDLKTWIKSEYSMIRPLCRMVVFNAVPAEQLTTKPGANSNSIAWLIWHIARVEDVAINTVIRDVPQVLTRGRWADRLRIDLTQMGTGSSDEEVDDFGKHVDTEQLIAYWDALGADTDAWIKALPLESLDEVPDVRERLKTAPGYVSPAGAWVEDIWNNKPASFFLRWVVIGHGNQHIGEMQAVRGQLGIKGL